MTFHKMYRNVWKEVLVSLNVFRKIKKRVKENKQRTQKKKYKNKM